MLTEEQVQTTGPSKTAPSTFAHGDELRPVHDLLDYAKQYAREKPTIVALWCFGMGFILGWKLKPW